MSDNSLREIRKWAQEIINSRERRDKAIWKAYSEGFNQKEIGEAAGRSRSRIQGILSKNAKEAGRDNSGK